MQLGSEFRCKLRVSVRDDGLEKAMVFPYLVMVDHGKSRAVKGVRDGKSMTLLGETVNYSKNCVTTFEEVEVYNKVNRYIFPGSSRDRIRDSRRL